MIRRCRTVPLLVVVLNPLGCTADFFVGPIEGSSSTTQGPDDTDGSSMPTFPTTTSGDGLSTTRASTTPDPELTTSSTSDESATSDIDTETETETETSEDTALDTESSTVGDTEDPEDCTPKEAPACEEAFPGCLWNGEECTVNLCNVGGEEACLFEAPECIWEGGGCIPSECAKEAECSALDPGPCEKAKGCMALEEQCFALACVPCMEVLSVPICDELPNCAYNEGREACLPQ
ncbi:MAG: hypothetical protein ACRBN8_11605 [Nannocystales bacterium]